ncbi:uncharacterized protein [Triticum aestivum]|uniref:uncharacterized protein isoform X5 n=1 Tax=Triticum aestivum TaxID=4565 RepID=UPI001D013B71|nr:uncharacterized protein LOC123092127 isoform X5 [Triticum aestivum]
MLSIILKKWEKEISPTGASKVTCHAPPTRPQVARCVVSACHQPQLWLNPHNELANWLLLLRAAKKLKKVTFLVSKFEMMIQFRKMDICQKQLRSSGHPYNSVELALHDRWRPQPNAVRPSFSGHRAAWIQRGCVAPASDPPASMPSPACVSPGPGSPSNTIRAMDKEKLLSGFWWPGIIDIEMNDYALRLFFWKRQVAMLYFMSFLICILLSYCLLPLVNCASSMGVIEHVQKYALRAEV